MTQPDKLSGWQPIDTAPKEQVEVIVYAPNENPSVFTAQNIYEWTRSSADIMAQRDDYFGDPDFKPTHWMPLPKPPEEV